MYVVEKSPLRAEHLEGTSTWIVYELYRVLFDTGLEIVVPKDTRTDFQSIPWYLRWVYSKAGPGADASVFHDWLCMQQAASGLTSEEAAEVFFVVMVYCGVPFRQAKLKYKAVLMGGPKWDLN